MRVGLLVCDHVDSALLDVAGDYDAMFARVFSKTPEIRLVPYDVAAGSLPDDPTECEAWITTGSRRSVLDDEPWIGDLSGFVGEVSRSGRRYVGVCFGHQLLARSLGGEVERSAAGWGVGLKEVVVPHPPEWLGVSSFRVLNSHADQVTSLPPGGEVLGGNDHCPVSLMRVGDNLVGIQGHPEFPTAYSEALLVARRGRSIPEDVADRALASLASEPDTNMLAAALGRFLQGG